jgi:hypothetical protein
MNLDNYLLKIQKEFAIDSIPSRKKIIRQPIYDSIIIEQKRAMIDLDGTIHKYSKGYDDGSIYDDPFEKARPVIQWLKNSGYEIIIFTTRASKGNAVEMGADLEKEIISVGNWLKLNNIPFDKITGDKLAADFYIDDKAIQISNGDWDAVKKEIIKRMKK